MNPFRLLKQTRQSTEYSCGASALQAVLSYWGKDLDEQDLMTLLHTTPETGTYPDDIVRVALILGFKAEVKENLTLESTDSHPSAWEFRRCSAATSSSWPSHWIGD